MEKYQIRVLHVPANRVAIVRALRLIGNHQTLRQAYNLALHLQRFPKSVVVAGIKESVARHDAAALTAAGAEVLVESSAVTTPMVCTPTANAKFNWRRWGPFRHIAKAA